MQLYLHQSGNSATGSTETAWISPCLVATVLEAPSVVKVDPHPVIFQFYKSFGKKNGRPFAVLLLTKPCFVLLGLVMYFNIANLDAKLTVAILAQDCSLVIQPFSIFRFGTFVGLCHLLCDLPV